MHFKGLNFSRISLLIPYLYYTIYLPAFHHTSLLASSSEPTQWLIFLLGAGHHNTALQQSTFTIADGILYFLDSRCKNTKRAVVPQRLQQHIVYDTRAHSSQYRGHFSGQHLYNALMAHWWWQGMLSDAVRFTKAYPEYAVVTGGGRARRPPLHPIPVYRHFRIVMMDFPLTDQGNKTCYSHSRPFTKWPLVFAVPDQKMICRDRLVAEEVILLLVSPNVSFLTVALTFSLTW